MKLPLRQFSKISIYMYTSARMDIGKPVETSDPGHDRILIIS